MITSPVIINEKALLETGQDKTKPPKALMEMNTKDNFMAEWQNTQIRDLERHHFWNSIALSLWILKSTLAKEASSMEEIFPEVWEAIICKDTLLHEEKESEDLQPATEEGDIVKSLLMLFKHLFVWGQEAMM